MRDLTLLVCTIQQVQDSMLAFSVAAGPAFQESSFSPACGFVIHRRCAYAVLDWRAVIAETPSARAACLFWARHFVLCLRLGESEVSVCGPGGNPQASVVFASLPDTVLVLTHARTHKDTNRHTFWQATSFSVRSLAGWECGACHLSKVSAAYMRWSWKLLLSAVFPLFLSLLTVLYWCVCGQRGNLTPASRQVLESNPTASFPARQASAQTTSESDWWF